MIIEAHYLPNIEYFVAISQFDEICLEVCENYQKQSYRNRCKILTTNKIDNLVVPVSKNQPKELLKNIRIDYSLDWTKRHLGAIKAAYGKAPFFEYFFDYFQIEILKKPDFLIDLNYELLTVCLKLLKQKKQIVFTEKYEKHCENDFRGKFHPKYPIKSLEIFSPFTYSQNFGENFAPNLSIIDLLMCQGNEANRIIEASKVKMNIIPKANV
jgi:WbqC-like protein family